MAASGPCGSKKIFRELTPNANRKELIDTKDENVLATMELHYTYSFILFDHISHDSPLGNINVDLIYRLILKCNQYLGTTTNLTKC